MLFTPTDEKKILGQKRGNNLVIQNFMMVELIKNKYFDLNHND